MKLIVGLGNPGEKYKLTRHNIGFLLVDWYAEKKGLEFKKYGTLYHYAEKKSNNSSYVLLKPDTYMNLSGDAVGNFVRNNEISPEDVLIIYDDLSIDVGALRLRLKGGDGGHNGMTSIIEKLKTQNFPRFRVGIGNEFSRGRMADYVLDKFSDEELKKLLDIKDAVFSVIDSFIYKGSKGALDYFSKINNK